jgi:hypothetical protein
MAYVKANIEKATGVLISDTVLWLFASNGNGLSCVRFSLACLGFHDEQSCPLCQQRFKGLSHFFACPQATSEMSEKLASIQNYLRVNEFASGPLEVLNNPSLLSASTPTHLPTSITCPIYSTTFTLTVPRSLS